MLRIRDTVRPADLPAERVAFCIGLLSDTHMPDRLAALPAALFDVLRGVDLLLHAGDVGELTVLTQLSAIAPVIAVHGNDETAEAQRELPYQQLVAVAGTRIVLTHAHYPERAEELESRRDDSWEPKLARRAAFGQRAKASVVVFGHTHVPMAVEHNDVLLVNPGALAAPNYTTSQKIRTVALLFISDKGNPFVTHIDLSAPDRAFVPQVDWQAGFRSAHDLVAASILSPELAADMPRLDPLLRSLLTREQMLSLARRVALPCWSGERTSITHADILATLRSEADVSPAVKAQLETVLTPFI